MKESDSCYELVIFVFVYVRLMFEVTVSILNQLCNGFSIIPMVPMRSCILVVFFKCSCCFINGIFIVIVFKMELYHSKKAMKILTLILHDICCYRL